jgi:PmbA protein
VDLNQLTDSVEALVQRRQVDGYEIMTGHSRALTIEVKDGAVDTFKCAAPLGVGLRVLHQGGMGFSFSTSQAPADLERMIDNALVGATAQTPDPCHGFASPQPVPELSGLFDPALAEVADRTKVARALDLERMTLAIDPRLRRVRKATYNDSTFFVQIRTSAGVHGGYCGTSVSSSIAVLAEADTDSQMGWDFGFSNFFAGVDIEGVARTAANKALGLLGARKIPTMRCPVVLDHRVATDILEVLAAAFLAENVQKGKSLLAGKVGTMITAPLIRIIDDGLLAGGMATTPFDGEGVPHRRTVLVEHGQLCGYLYDTFWGRKCGAASTGNAVRGGVKGMPGLGVTNFFIENGTATVADLCGGIDRGLLLTDVMGMHTANPISGDFSVGASGFLVEAGELQHPVKEIVVSGNILDLFKNVTAVGNDLRFFGAVGAPSLKIAELDISGS